MKMKMHLPKIILLDGNVEAVKWFGLVSMTCDHINKYLFNGTLPVLFQVGRLAMPLFVFILAFNLARPEALARGIYSRTMIRLAVFSAIASLPFIALGGVVSGWWPLNILFMFLVLTITLYLIELGTTAGYAAAVGMFLIGGSSVEFFWPALTFGLAVWLYSKCPSWLSVALGFTSLASLYFINSNMWALAVVPVVFLASILDLRIPRLRWLFYVYYPVHLIALWLIRIPMGKAGYLFFY